MGDALSSGQRVLMVSRRAGEFTVLRTLLDEAGLVCARARSAAAAEIMALERPVEAVLVDLGDGHPDEARRLAAALRRPEAGRPVLIALAPEGAPEAPEGAFDLVIRRARPQQICARLQDALRMGVQRAESQLRRGTLAAMGVDIPPEPEPDKRKAILFVGSADPAFLHLRGALKGADAEIVAAFTSFTAFDYLHDRVFHAVVLSALQGADTAFTICSAMRRNARLIHIPALLMAEPDFSDIDEAFARGASDILSTDNPLEETRQRVLSLAEERQRGLALRAAFDQVRDPAVLDRPSGLFNRDVFAAHLGRMADWSVQTQRPLTVAVFRAQASLFSDVRPSQSDLAAARDSLGGMLRHLVRTEDFAARLDPGVFALAMPATGSEEGRAAAGRVRSAAECAAFETDHDGEFRLALHMSCAELREGESAPRLLKRAVDGLARRTAPGLSAAS